MGFSGDKVCQAIILAHVSYLLTGIPRYNVGVVCTGISRCNLSVSWDF